MTSWRDFRDVPMFAYDFIMADPNWLLELRSPKGEAKSPQAQYHCDPVEIIKEHRVGEMAAPDCVLWLWATNPMLPAAFDCLAHWGFRFVTAGHWVKTTKNKSMNWGPGYVLRSCGEPYLIGVRESGEIAEGSPFLIGKMGSPDVVAKNVPSVILGEVCGHSRKPQAAYAAAERMMPNARRLDLFSRSDRPGWDCAGHEVGKFSIENERE